MSQADWGRTTPYDDVSGEVAIVGVGETEYTAQSGRASLAMAMEATQRAIDDAGLKPRDIDGLMYTGIVNDFITAEAFHHHFGTSHDLWLSPQGGSFTYAATAPYVAAQALRAGKAKHIVNVFAIDWATQVKQQTGGPATYHQEEPMKANLEVIYGFIPQPVYFAAVARRHAYEFGTTPEMLGSIAVTQRRHANGHPGAVMRHKELTLEKYLARKPFIEPLRVEDCCLISDGAGAYVITSAERAKSLPHRPAIVAGVGHGVSNTGTYFAQQAAFTATPQVFSAPSAFAMAGIKPSDVDVLAVYDPFTIVAMMQIEDMGFCVKGEAGRMALDGKLYYKTTRRLGGLPFNTHGGLLSHAYLLGICHVIELVRQIRRKAANQVEDCEIAVFGGYTGGDAGTLVLRQGG
jgi:acetyl-CoA acetyltransferase